MNFKNWLENQQMKQLILLRGVSGSGKSTLAKEYLDRGGVVHSTDDFFMKDGIYQFDSKKIGYYHKLNQKRTEEAMINGQSPIIIDNTNLQAWEMKPYVEMADKHGYEVKIIESDMTDIDELMRRQENRRAENKNLPKEVLQRMLSKYQRNITADDIRNSKSPF